MNWSQIRAFLETAKSGSLSAAARELALTQPTLSRQVSALEQDLRVLLFERGGHKLTLTQAGRDLLPHAQAMGEAAQALTLNATGHATDVAGKVSISASDVNAAYIMPPFLHQVQQVAPLIDVELVAENALSDLLKREADIAIRHVDPAQPDLVAQRICTGTAGIYASKPYLEKRGIPKTIADLKQHTFIGFGDPDFTVTYLADRGISLSRDQVLTGSASGIVSWELVKNGHGLALMADYIARVTPGIVRVLPDTDPVEFPIWLVVHREVQTSRKIRLVFDLLKGFVRDTMGN